MHRSLPKFERKGTFIYQSRKQFMHIEWQQVGKTTLARGSKHIPHSSSLSESVFVDTPSKSASVLLLPALLCTLFSSWISSSSTESWSCSSDGNITAASWFFKQQWENFLTLSCKMKRADKATNRKSPWLMLSFHMPILLAFHRCTPVDTWRVKFNVQKAYTKTKRKQKRTGDYPKKVLN